MVKNDIYIVDKVPNSVSSWIQEVLVFSDHDRGQCRCVHKPPSRSLAIVHVGMDLLTWLRISDSEEVLFCLLPGEEGGDPSSTVDRSLQWFVARRSRFCSGKDYIPRQYHMANFPCAKALDFSCVKNPSVFEVENMWNSSEEHRHHPWKTKVLYNSSFLVQNVWSSLLGPCSVSPFCGLNWSRWLWKSWKPPRCYWTDFSYVLRSSWHPLCSEGFTAPALTSSSMNGLIVCF